MVAVDDRREMVVISISVGWPSFMLGVLQTVSCDVPSQVYLDDDAAARARYAVMSR